MTEREYIDATNLAKVRCALACLREIINLDVSTIPPSEHGLVMRTVCDWEERLTEKVKTED
jgi:hypothetical protein